MACIEVPSANADSEMEEGEIVDEVDVLSDISSEEEFLLRQRLQVLENYNNVLERKEAKRTSIGSGKEYSRREILCDLSEISGTDPECGFKKLTLRISNDKKHVRPHHKSKKLRQIDKDPGRIKDHKKKNHRKKKIGLKSDSDSSQYSDDDYLSKRRKLADAVSFNKEKHDTSTLKDRLTKMLSANKVSNQGITQNVIKNNKVESSDKEPSLVQVELKDTPTCNESIEAIKNTDISQDVVDSSIEKKEEIRDSDGTSDEDLEMLRQHALKTKSAKAKNDLSEKNNSENKADINSEDEDSDTAELRMICLKSALLKKAIEMKQKQKLQKRLSQSSNMHEFDISNQDDINVDNNTDIESVDMDIGSDGDDKGKVYITECSKPDTKPSDGSQNVSKDDELEEDEDLLRAKLLTSLSKNLPNLVDLNVLDKTLKEVESKNEDTKVKTQPKNIEKKKFIIQLGESDSEGEDEATKNLTEMHMKLSKQAEFQQKLDLFLKSTRMEVEKTTLPDVVQEPLPRPPEKFVAKAMNHLPKSEQIEYKNLVKRMAELEKVKQARQNILIMNNMTKETLKSRNVSLESYKLESAKKLEEKIALSRKRIAEESAKMLKLKEEATKLSQRYKIVATELRNITTAITLNKRQQKTVQNGLYKIRHQHQILLKSSPIKHSNQILYIRPSIDKVTANKLQKENDPLKEEHKNPNNLKAVKVCVVNDFKETTAGNPNPKLSVQVDVCNNKKIVKLPKSPLKDRIVDFKKPSQKKTQDEWINERTEIMHEVESKRLQCLPDNDKAKDNFNEYKSPLDALQCKNWEEDPNGVLCPFEFSGSCRDAECKYIHPKVPKQ
ncbi:unnamed protein product, partial [Brenthis ino]